MKPLCEPPFPLERIEEMKYLLHTILYNMIEQQYEGNPEMLAYLECAVNNMVVRIKTAVETQQLRRIFVL